LLFKSVAEGRTEIPAALRVIRAARRRAEKVRALLRELGNDAETLPLNRRFRGVAKEMPRRGTDKQTGHLFAELSGAVHDLNLLLSESFYPGDTQ
jgi:hypothetical protein